MVNDISDPGCGCGAKNLISIIFQAGGDKGLCYVEGIVKDYTGQDLHENVWYSMKPPKHVGAASNPQVSARTVEVTRAELTGKVNINKVFNETVRTAEDKHNIVDIQKRKAGVHFVKMRGQ